MGNGMLKLSALVFLVLLIPSSSNLVAQPNQISPDKELGQLRQELRVVRRQFFEAKRSRDSEVEFEAAIAEFRTGDAESGASNFEFIEIMNISNATIELDQASFGDGIEFTFAAQLGAGERLVVVSDPVAFVSRYGNDVPIAKGARGFENGFSSRLANDGENTAIHSAAGEVIESFAFGDQRGWADRADGKGSTLERTDTSNDPSRPGSWQPSSTFHGSPGTSNQTVARSVVINEVTTNNATAESTNIELLNVSDTASTLNGYLSNSGTNPLKYRIQDAVLDANSYLVFDSTQLQFEFNSDGPDDAWLLASDTTGRPIHFLDVVEFPATPVGVCGRSPNGSGEFALLSSPTIGSTNSTPAVDLNNDQAINEDDVDMLCTAIANGSNDMLLDLTDDNRVDLADMRYLIEMVMQTNFGDANLDGQFDSRDLVQVFSAAEFEDEIAGNSMWAEGDWNCDGDATTRDLVVAFQSGTYGEFARPVIEQTKIAAWRDQHAEQIPKRDAVQSDVAHGQAFLTRPIKRAAML